MFSGSHVSFACVYVCVCSAVKMINGHDIDLSDEEAAASARLSYCINYYYFVFVKKGCHLDPSREAIH